MNVNMPRDVVAESPTVRLAALGGMIGPAAFIGGWTLGAAMTRREYSSVDQAISRLAEVGADSRVVMTTGFVALGIGVPVYATALRSAVGGYGWIAATATGITTLIVAATPLARSTVVDTAHTGFAAIGYVTLAATPCCRLALCSNEAIVDWPDSELLPASAQGCRWYSRPADCRPACSNASA